MDTLALLGYLVQIATVMNMVSGVPLAVQMLKTGNAQNVPFLFFVMAQFGAIGFLHYGLLMDNSVLILLNLLGVVINCFYIGSYLYVTPKKTRPLFVLLSAAAMLSVLYIYLYYYCPAERMTSTLGKAAAAVVIIMNCVPALDIAETLKTKSADFDRIMLLAGMVTCGLWFMYGRALGDFNVYGPNIPFLLTGAVKLLLTMRYSRSAFGMEESKDR